MHSFRMLKKLIIIIIIIIIIIKIEIIATKEIGIFMTLLHSNGINAVFIGVLVGSKIFLFSFFFTLCPLFHCFLLNHV
jgi:hypothetical protein